VRVAAVVEVDQVDPAGDRTDVVHDGAEVPPGGPRVAGVEDEAGAELPDGVPEAGEGVQLARHGVAAPGGVLDEQRKGEAAVLGLVGERLAPVVHPHGRVVGGQHVAAVHHEGVRADLRGGLRVRGQQLAPRDADAVVRRRHVEHVRRMDHDQDVARPQVLGVRPGLRIGVALRVGQEDLDPVGVHLRRPGERSAVLEPAVVGQTRADVYADRVSSRGAGHACRP